MPTRSADRDGWSEPRDGEWFDPPLAVALNWHRATLAPSRYAIPVEGADFDTVGWRHERDGALEGNATIYGQWLGDRIRIQRQTQEPVEPAPPLLRDPPGPAPPDGWTVSPDGTDPDDFGVVDVDHLQGTGAATMVAVFQPGPGQAVLVVAVDIAAVEAQLRPRLRDRLCVVASRWTPEQLDGVTARIWDRAPEGGVYGTGRSCDAQAQPVVTVELVRVTEQIASWADAQPAELVDLKPCLTPIGVDDR